MSLLPALPGLAQLAPGDYQRSITHDGYDRSYRFHVPVGYDDSVPTPLVVDIHGLGQTGLQQRSTSGYLQLSNSQGFVIAYPEGYSQSWNNGDTAQGQAHQLGIDDVGFIKTMIHAIAGELSIDPSRLYATGISAGGGMTQRLACDASDYFAAAAPLARGFPFILVSKCDLSRPVPIHLSLGTTDQIVPYAGAVRAFTDWKDLNGCPSPAPDETVLHGTSSSCESYTDCDLGSKVTLCSVVGNAQFQGHLLYVNDDNVDLAWEGWSHLVQYEHESPPVLLPEPGAAAQSMGALMTVGALASIRRRRTAD